MQRKGDTKECFNIGRLDGEPPQPLPPVFLENYDFLKKFGQSCHALCLNVLGLMSEALEVPADYLPSRHVFSEDTTVILRLLRYAKVDSMVENDELDPRAGSHTDYGCITLLFQHDLPGLEVKYNNVWNPVKVRKDCVLVNVGDQLQLMTRGLFKSSIHRVVTVKEQLHSDRFSIAYFCHANGNVLMEAIPSKHVQGGENSADLAKMTAGEYLHKKLTMTYVDGKYWKYTFLLLTRWFFCLANLIVLSLFIKHNGDNLLDLCFRERLFNYLFQFSRIGESLDMEIFAIFPKQ